MPTLVSLFSTKKVHKLYPREEVYFQTCASLLCNKGEIYNDNYTIKTYSWIELFIVFTPHNFDFSCRIYDKINLI